MSSGFGLRGPGFAVALAAAACGPAARPADRPVTVTAGPRESESLVRERLIGELTEDILASYESDDPPEVETDMVRAEIGGARIGFAADDIVVGEALARPHSLWRRDPPATTTGTRLYVDGGSELRSKDLRITLAADRSAAWVSDELSWRLPACGKAAVVPLRSTALYAHDGDRWILVFQHVSFARALQVPFDTPRHPIRPAVLRDVADPLSSVLQRALAGRTDAVIANDAELIGPEMTQDWRGKDILHAQIGGGSIRAQERRIGTIGRIVGRATVAYWIGDFDVDVTGGKVPLRGTFVFEKRGGAWQLVQGHLSEATTDEDLAARVFGTAILSLAPLRLTCGA